MIYSKERPRDYATQSIHQYGTFDHDRDYVDFAEDHFNKYKDMWEICKKEPIDTDEYGSIKSRVYKGYYGFMITVTELPIQEFQVILSLEDDVIIDKVQIMKNAKELFDEIYHKDPVTEEAKRVEYSINGESGRIDDLIAKRIIYKKEMLKHPSDSKEYKAAKKKVDELKEEINRLFSENDDMLINFKERK